MPREIAPLGGVQGVTAGECGVKGVTLYVEGPEQEEASRREREPGREEPPESPGDDATREPTTGTGHEEASRQGFEDAGQE